MITLFIDREIKMEIKSLTQCCIVEVVEPTLEFGSPSSSTKDHEFWNYRDLCLNSPAFCPFIRM